LLPKGGYGGPHRRSGRRTVVHEDDGLATADQREVGYRNQLVPAALAPVFLPGNCSRKQADAEKATKERRKIAASVSPEDATVLPCPYVLIKQ
jgi:hypothetical protein